MKAAPTKQTGVDLLSAHLWLDVMEEQKEDLRALISVLQSVLDIPDCDPDVRTLLSIAAKICEDHGSWYKLRDCLGKKSSGAKGVGDD